MTRRVNRLSSEINELKARLRRAARGAANAESGSDDVSPPRRRNAATTSAAVAINVGGGGATSGAYSIQTPDGSHTAVLTPDGWVEPDQPHSSPEGRSA